MRAKGIGYDTGFSFDGVTCRPFTPELVRRELQIIRDDLHCTAVRLFGNDLDRLDFAARTAADLGLEVWYSPFTYQLDPDEMLEFLADAAERAARIPASTSTWPAGAWSRSSRGAPATPTRTCRGSRRPRSGRWPTTTAERPYRRRRGS